jgi:FAD/FMN-containing dehydrogenase
MGADFIDAARKILGKQGVLEGDEVEARYYTDWRGASAFIPSVALRPETTAELSEIMKLCHAFNQPVAVQGGMTGLVEAARPREGEVVLSLERMAKVEEIRSDTGTMVVQAGARLQAIQEAAEARDMFFPLDLGARGSCSIGGNLATNAGGNRVIRYGMTRDLVLGLEVVLADGTIISSLNAFIKNNTGYDLKQLFVGSEGTLGIITRAVLQLSPKPRSQSVAFCGVENFGSVVRLLGFLKVELGQQLSAFEVLWPATYRLITTRVEGVKPPLPEGHGFYVLVEAMGMEAMQDPERFEAVLAAALEAELISDAVLSKSDAEATRLWEVRDNMAAAIATIKPTVTFDISLSIDDMEQFSARLHRDVIANWPDAGVHIGGHLGDGNLHVIVGAHGTSPHPTESIEDLVYGLVEQFSGSVSAEHGIGISKRKYLPKSRSAAEINLMRGIKRAFDEKNILSRGRIFDLPT